MKVPETFFSVSEELWLFLISCGWGAVIGLFYDVLRTVRMILPHNFFLTAVEDVLFLLCYGVFLNAFSSAAAHGQARGFFVLGNILGFSLYIATVGRIVTGMMKKLIIFVKGLMRIAAKPFGKCYVFLRKKSPFKFVGCSKISVKSVKKVKMLLPTSHKLLYNKTENKKKRNVKNVVQKKKKRKKERTV